jgi:hypothetical protein
MYPTSFRVHSLQTSPRLRNENPLISIIRILVEYCKDAISTWNILPCLIRPWSFSQPRPALPSTQEDASMPYTCRISQPDHLHDFLTTTFGRSRDSHP